MRLERMNGVVFAARLLPPRDAPTHRACAWSWRPLLASEMPAAHLPASHSRPRAQGSPAFGGNPLAIFQSTYIVDFCVLGGGSRGRFCQFQVLSNQQRRVTHRRPQHPLPNRHFFPTPKRMLYKYDARRLCYQHDIYVNVNSDGIPTPSSRIHVSNANAECTGAHVCILAHEDKPLPPLPAPEPTWPSRRRYINNTSPAANGYFSIISFCTHAQLRMGRHLSPQRPHLLDTFHILKFMEVLIEESISSLIRG